MGQGMESAQLLKGISVGTILWIKELTNGDGRERYGLPSNCFQHPCVVVDLGALRKGFVQIYVITSKGDRNVNDVPLPRHVRSRYVPIHPKPTNTLLPGVQLRLAGSSKLRKDSYINTEKVYTFPLACLEPYSRRQRVSDFRLDPDSICWLRAKAFGEPLLDAPIEQTITPTASTSRVPTDYSPVQRPPPYAAAPAAQPQAYNTFRNDELPYSSRPRNTTQIVVPIVGISILAAIAALLLFTLWL